MNGIFLGTRCRKIGIDWFTRYDHRVTRQPPVQQRAARQLVAAGSLAAS
jgi:hypothetical protein